LELQTKGDLVAISGFCQYRRRWKNAPKVYTQLDPPTCGHVQSNAYLLLAVNKFHGDTEHHRKRILYRRVTLKGQKIQTWTTASPSWRRGVAHRSQWIGQETYSFLCMKMTRNSKDQSTTASEWTDDLPTTYRKTNDLQRPKTSPRPKNFYGAGSLYSIRFTIVRSFLGKSSFW
jgi:hypothetical protein